VSETERALLASAQQGNTQAFAQLVAAYQMRVFNLCNRMLGDPYEAEDAAQETFLRAFKAIKRYDLDRPFATWLLTIASRYCIDQLRRRRLQTFSIEKFLETGLADPAPGPEASMARVEEQNRMQELLHVLKPADRAAVVMRYWYEFSYEEIAQALSLSVSAIKSRLHRARKELAMAWAEQKHTIPSQRVIMEKQRYESPAI
jgi:RNA polymerase sigma-70 factor (ECF subfamily)